MTKSKNWPSVLLCSALLCACTGKSETPLPNYAERLSRALEQTVQPAAPYRARLPRPRELQVPVSSGTIDLLDLLALDDCALQVTIAKSNSSLGKLATDSQSLLLALEFLQLVPACIETLRQSNQSQLAAALAIAQLSKQQQLPALIWNATLGGPEFRQLWKIPAHLGQFPNTSSDAVGVALARLLASITAWLQGDYTVGRTQLESLLGTIRQGQGGALLRAESLQAATLAAATSAVKQRRDKQAMCFEGHPGPQAKILETVVLKYFVGEVQPWLVQMERQRRSLLPTVRSLENTLAAVTPPGYQAWQLLRDQQLTVARSQPKEHAQALSELLHSCGLAPGAAPQYPN